MATTVTSSQYSPWTEQLRQVLVDVLADHGETLEENLLRHVNGTPSLGEMDGLEKAIRLDKRNGDIILAYAQALTEMLRAFEDKAQEEPISFGTKRTFGSREHLRNYIYDQCLKLCEIDPISLKYNLGVATLCTSSLPHWAINSQLAKLCLDRALIFHQASSKALTRMGFYKLKFESDLSSAREYFQQATTNNPEDFRAAIAMLYSLFKDIEIYKDRVNVLLKAEFMKSCWTDEQRAALYFIRGLFQYFYEGYEKDVAISWTMAFVKSEKEFLICLEHFGRIKKLYQFPVKYNDVFTLANFCDVLKTSFAYPEVDLGILKAVRSLIKSVGRKQLQEQNEKSRTRATSKMSGKSFHTTGKSFKNPYTRNYMTIGSGDNVSEAFQTFGIPETSGKCVVYDKYKKICRELECIKKQPECDHDEISKKMFEFNSALASLHQHFDKQGTDDEQEHLGEYTEGGVTSDFPVVVFCTK